MHYKTANSSKTTSNILAWSLISPQKNGSHLRSHDTIILMAIFTHNKHPTFTFTDVSQGPRRCDLHILDVATGKLFNPQSMSP